MCARDTIDVADLNLRSIPSLAAQMRPGAAMTNQMASEVAHSLRNLYQASGPASNS